MNSTHPGRKQKIKHELKEMLSLSIYLAFFFCALAIYDMLLLRQYNVEYWTIAFALINALVITKVIMIGEYAKLGRRHEDKALLISAVWKAFVFGLFVFAFHVVEEVIKPSSMDLTRQKHPAIYALSNLQVAASSCSAFSFLCSHGENFGG